MNIVQKESRMKGIPDAALRQMYANMARDPYKVGTPEFLLVAGEVQSRKDAAQKAALGQGNKTPVVQDLLAYVGGMPQQQMPQMPQQQMAQAPAEAGIAAMRAPSAEQQFAAGGIVAFRDGGVSLSDEQEKLILERAAAYGLNPDFVLNAVKDSPADKVQTLFDDLGIRSVVQTDVPALPAKATPIADYSQADTGAQMGAAPAVMAPVGLPQKAEATPLGKTDVVPSRLMRLFGAGGPEVGNVFEPGAQPTYDTSRQQVAPSALTRYLKERVPQTDPGFVPQYYLDQGKSDTDKMLEMVRQQQAGQDSSVVPSPQTPPPAADGDKITVEKIPDAEDKKPAAGLPSLDQAGIMGIAKEFAGALPAEITTKDKAAVEDQFKLYKEMGVDLDPYKKIKERLAGAESEYEKQRNEAGLMALAQFGFNWASNTGPTLAAAAKAGASIMPGVMDSLKDLRKLKREDEKLGAEIAAFDSRMRKDITDKARSELQAKKNRVEDRRNAVNDNAARIGGTIYGQQLASQTSITTTEMTTEATVARLKQQLGETQTKNIVDAATKLATGNSRYAFAPPAEKDTILNNAIQQVLRARLAASTTVTPSQ